MKNKILSNNNPAVYIAFCIDAEGPLYEDEDAVFERLKYHFGIDIKPTRDNLRKLQRGEGLSPSLKEKVGLLLRPRLVANLPDLPAMTAMLDRITAAPFRRSWQDSRGRGLVYSWFCLDHVGYEENPRRRIMGHHAIFDFYRNYLCKEDDAHDAVQFHYHPLPYNKRAHACATYYFNANHLTTILARKIIERTWFPSVFRPGFHTIRPDSHWFLEQWMPFDYSNQSCDSADAPSDLTPDQYGDWRRAPRLWGGYHPDHDDYQKEGSCRRRIFRCLNADSRIRNYTEQDIREAFEQAEKNGKSVLAVTDHDFRNMESSIRTFYDAVAAVASKHPQVDVIFSNALEAARAYADTPAASCRLTGSVKPLATGGASVLEVACEAPIFGPQPYLALRTTAGEYFYDNFDCDAEHYGFRWTYTFSWQTFPLNAVECIGIAAPTLSGVVDILRIFPHTQLSEKTVLFA